jgi:hypothetical protein
MVNVRWTFAEIAHYTGRDCRGPASPRGQGGAAPRGSGSQISTQGADNENRKGFAHMMVKSFSKIVVAVAVLMLALVIAAPAFAITTSSTTTQVGPGLMQRVIWSQCQSAAYTVNVTHAGNIHAELDFNPSWGSNAMSVFIFDQSSFSIVNINQGWYQVANGKFMVDWWVNDISTAGRVVIPADGDVPAHLTGDNYQIIAVVYDDWNTRFHIWGYAQQTDLSLGSNPLSDNTFYTQNFRFPATGEQRLMGAPYGNPFDFKVTSTGAITNDLTWPANVRTKTVGPELLAGQAPAVWEQYLYTGTNWDTSYGGDYLTPTGGWWPNSWDGNTWAGLRDEITVSTADAINMPNLVYHYAPALDMVSSDYYLTPEGPGGPFVPLHEGVSTMGYKATLTYPSNLYIKSATPMVAMGAKATVKGNYALNGAWVSTPTKVTLQFRAKGSSTWVKVATAMTGTDGAWSATFTVTKAGVVRAQAPGDSGTGLAVETAVAKSIGLK